MHRTHPAMADTLTALYTLRLVDNRKTIAILRDGANRTGWNKRASVVLRASGFANC